MSLNVMLFLRYDYNGQRRAVESISFLSEEANARGLLFLARQIAIQSGQERISVKLMRSFYSIYRNEVTL